MCLSMSYISLQLILPLHHQPVCHHPVNKRTKKRERERGEMEISGEREREMKIEEVIDRVEKREEDHSVRERGREKKTKTK